MKNLSAVGRRMELTLSGSLPFRKSALCQAPVGFGIYILHDLRGTLYVGKSSNLRKRLEDHCDLETNPLIAVAVRNPIGQIYASWMNVEESDIARIESELIIFFDPPCNRIKGSK